MKKVLSVTALFLFATLAFAADKGVELKFGHYLVESHPAHAAAVAFAAAVESRTGGAVKIVI